MDKEHIACYKSPGEAPLYWKTTAKEISFNEINFENIGLLLSPFETNKTCFFLPGKGTTKPIKFRPIALNNKPENESHLLEQWQFIAKKERFIEHIIQIQKAIQASEVEKVVAFRTAIELVDQHVDLNVFLDLLIKEFPQAYILVYQYDNQVFITASPELLLSIKGNVASTVALAGTAAWEKRNELGIKESEEQDYIAKHIDKLLTYNQLVYQKEQKEIIKAGHLAHYVNRYTFELPVEKRKTLLAALHPTPAVGGFTKDDALLFIQQNEAYTRNWYAGFAGNVGPTETVLSVNIRCLQIINQTAVFFAGAGITKDSNPEKEWNETTLKLQTLLRLFKDQFPK
jgi:isochorismate synthase